MQKEKTKKIANHVGADGPVCPNHRGITLIALVITIIVMLILVGVSVTVALNGGLFSTAQGAARDTEAEKEKELALSNGDIIDKYLSGTAGGNGGSGGTITLPTGWSVAETKPTGGLCSRGFLFPP